MKIKGRRRKQNWSFFSGRKEGEDDCFGMRRWIINSLSLFCFSDTKISKFEVHNGSSKKTKSKFRIISTESGLSLTVITAPIKTKQTENNHALA